MYCTKCGTGVPDGARNCTNCGSLIIDPRDEELKDLQLRNARTKATSNMIWGFIIGVIGLTILGSVFMGPALALILAFIVMVIVISIGAAVKKKRK